MIQVSQTLKKKIKSCEFAHTALTKVIVTCSIVEFNLVLMPDLIVSSFFEKI